MTPLRVAAVDIGTNAVLLVIVEHSARGLLPLVERATITRLGEGVDRTRCLSEAAMSRTLRCLEQYAKLIVDHGVQQVKVVCTSAARDADNGFEFVGRTEATVGHRPRILSGAEEATLAFSGALSGLDVEGDVTVVDVGGGSTEVALGTIRSGRAELHRHASFDIGSVRLTERHVRGDPPASVELDLIRADIRGALAARDCARRPSGGLTGAPRSADGGTLVGTAGTVTSLLAIELGLLEYDPRRVHGATLPLSTVRTLRGRLSAMGLPERRQIAGLDPKRADVIVAGALIVEETLEWAGAEELVVSDRGLRWGLIACAVAESARSVRP